MDSLEHQRARLEREIFFCLSFMLHASDNAAEQMRNETRRVRKGKSATLHFDHLSSSLCTSQYLGTTLGFSFLGNLI